MSPSPTERLRFRSWAAADLDLARRLWGDPRVTRYIDVREVIPEAEVRSRLQAERAFEAEHGFQYWPIFEGDAFVGCCGLRPYAPRVAELGVHLVVEAWCRGLATEAARAVVTHARSLDLDALFAGHNPDNAPSRRMLEKLGFTYTHDELYAPTGRLHPSYRLEL